MLKLDPSTPETDEGWVYGTLSADGQRVTAAGRVESCMDCHVDEGRDRMYGHRRGRVRQESAPQIGIPSQTLSSALTALRRTPSITANTPASPRLVRTKERIRLRIPICGADS